MRKATGTVVSPADCGGPELSTRNSLQMAWPFGASAQSPHCPGPAQVDLL